MKNNKNTQYITSSKKMKSNKNTQIKLFIFFFTFCKRMRLAFEVNKYVMFIYFFVKG